MDAVSLGAKPSPLAKLCAHLAKGAFTHNPPHLRDRLVAVALATFGADAECRQSLSLPALHEADFRTACLCCTRPRSWTEGCVRATCLSVYCRADHECPCTKARGAKFVCVIAFRLPLISPLLRQRSTRV